MNADERALDGIRKRTIKFVDEYMANNPDCLTQKEFTTLTGIAVNRITKWRSGEASPSIMDIYRICEKCGASAELLIFGRAISASSRANVIRSFEKKLDDLIEALSPELGRNKSRNK